MNRSIARILLVLLVTLLGPGPRAWSAAPTAGPGANGVPDDLRASLEALRSDVNGFKIRVLNEAMGLTAPEAEKFWPLYRQYEKELAALGDRKVALIREYLALREAGPLEASVWVALSGKWLANAQARLDLWKRYQKRIGRSVSPMRAAQFLQVEHQMALLIDLSIASEMPALGQAGR